MEDQIKQIMAYAFNMPVHKLTEYCTSETIEGWDSLSHLTMIAEFESAFDISFSPSEIEEYKSYQQISESVARKLKEINAK
ncbi:acyl carrier protein [Chryseobacterium indologenes]|uniref:acyl carrier protein n=1 Tax=Chryseobacterium indologenes TaxID=253 RepID=UPI000BFBDD0A|nr:acyl carrier protein [Chryseobacterium indologenes]ATN07630.1 acyl carrier protein [Chryseobacterium indologenes]AYY83630.1 acyl carrier protein [Chryseobacterium indologenes]QIX80552.1 acyl carrier protein [Chryseobacterium indologenes]UDQ54210.1 acyl carrier protein [Chryseobacterium indologenes]HAO28743.1 acyl carrier protein [Chryseobacterium indologenes]